MYIPTNESKKTKLHPDIEKIKIGEKDSSGNIIIDVLAKQNEFAIYEIDTIHIQNRIKVLISGHTDISENKLIDRFNKIKMKYIEAKGVLLHTTNFEKNKQLIAHTLSAQLNSDSVDNKLFDTLIENIQNEHETALRNRVCYLLPSMISTILFFIKCIYIIEERLLPTTTWTICSSLLAASLGGCTSMVISSKELNFQEYKQWYSYIYVGSERLIFSILTGAISFIVIKSGLISSNILSESYWTFIMILVIAGFSERLIPSILTKSESSISINT
ncbi:hypothetical protein [Neisseria montereyensis]|uniref:Uncharacterized protein n=1 Tax=Neisseria montereyensis TaxID=2973938 RepID=A0ABT2FA57_9NEIS|nr:hypothetical protein [Neisseria montereyensis]MCS4533089.1 hypothetical protein [Neisseria montereyensis]